MQKFGCVSARPSRRAILVATTGAATALAFGMTAGSAWADPPSKSEVKGATNVTAQQVQEIATREGDRLRVIDARRPGSWEKSRIANATKLNWRWSNITKAWSFDRKDLGPDKNAPLVIYGSDPSDGYAALAAEKAVAEGYANVMWLRGGFAEWVAANGPVAS